jgi:hypothetical protein
MKIFILSLLLAGSTHADGLPQPAEDLAQGLATEGMHSPLGQELLALSGKSQSLAGALSHTTQLAISPLLALTAMSAWKWWQSDADLRANLPFYCQPWCWGAGLLILALVLFKEVVIARIPGAKKPLDALQLIENKVSGLLVSPIAIGALAWALERSLQGLGPRAVASLVWGTALASDGALQPSALDPLLAWLFAVVGAGCIYGSVWLASHTINVLILLSPFAVVDNALKLARLSLLVAVAVLSKVAPSAGALVCGALVVGALLSAGFSYRLMRFGLSFVVGFLRTATDVASHRRFWAFSGPALPLKLRTAGWLEMTGQTLTFRYRRAFVLPRVLELDPSLRIERGVLHPVAVDARGRLAFRLTPLVRGKEDGLARALGGLTVEDQPMVRGLKGLWGWVNGALGGTIETELDVR